MHLPPLIAALGICGSWDPSDLNLAQASNNSL
jgi:hypothetical protein